MDDARGVHREPLLQFVEDWGNTARGVIDDTGDAPGPLNAPVSVVTAMEEDVRLEDLGVTLNPAFSKLVVVFAQLSTETARLRRAAEETLFPALAIFGEHSHIDGSDAGLPEGEVQVVLARSLKHLQDTVLFLEQVYAVALNLFEQLSALYTDIPRVYSPLQAVRLSTAFVALGECLGLAAGLDEAVTENTALPVAFDAFRRMLPAVRANPVSFPAEEVGDLEGIESVVKNLESRILAANAFDIIVDKLVGLMGEGGHPQHFLDQMSKTAFDGVNEITARLLTKGERPSDRTNLMSLMCLAVLHSRLMPLQVDERLCKVVWDVHKTAIMLPVSRIHFIQPLEFLCRYLPTSAVELGPPQPLEVAHEARCDALDRIVTTLKKELSVLLMEGAAWIADLEIKLAVNEKNVHAAFGRHIRLLSDGIHIGHRIRNRVQETIQLHDALEAPLTNVELRMLARGLELLHGINSSYKRHNTKVALELQHLLSFALDRLTMLVVPAKQVLEEALTSVVSGWSRMQITLSGKWTGAELAREDAVAAASLAETVLSGPATKQRLKLIRLCFDILEDAYVMSDETSADADELIDLIDVLANMDVRADDACDTSFLYKCGDLFPACLADVYDEPDEAHRLNLLVQAFSASIGLLNRGKASKQQIAAFEQELLDALDDEIIRPLCVDIDTDIRRHVHSACSSGAANVDAKDIGKFLRVVPLRVVMKEFDIRSQVALHLNASFHNQPAVSIDDAKMREDMRSLAIGKYGLPLSEDELPLQTMKEGIDALEVIRDVHLFVSEYSYDFHSQCYVERANRSGFGIQHVSSSIQTHGMGFTRSVISSVHEYLTQCLLKFSQILFDDKIRSVMAKESRTLRREQSGPKSFNSAATPAPSQDYSMDRSVRLLRDFRRLPLAEDGSTFLEQFRLLITDVGNALGCLRLLRLGIMHTSAQEAKLFPGLKSCSRVIKATAKSDEMPASTVEAAKTFDSELELLRKHPAKGTNFFNVLVHEFAGKLEDINDEHLNDFYLMIPALSLHAVESVVSIREKLARRGKEDAANFADDGFAVGTAFLLCILDQSAAFDRLNWKNNVMNFYMDEKAREAATNRDEDARGASDDAASDDETDNQWKLGKVQATVDEFVLLHFCLESARTFLNHS